MASAACMCTCPLSLPLCLPFSWHCWQHGNLALTSRSSACDFLHFFASLSLIVSSLVDHSCSSTASSCRFKVECHLFSLLLAICLSLGTFFCFLLRNLWFSSRIQAWALDVSQRFLLPLDPLCLIELGISSSLLVC